MHHNEGIQANTEFEYLRNILFQVNFKFALKTFEFYQFFLINFQYLSGHVNANGTTLVKVIAAVLKFTPQQTQLVLEKENQRHTLVSKKNLQTNQRLHLTISLQLPARIHQQLAIAGTQQHQPVLLLIE